MNYVTTSSAGNETSVPLSAGECRGRRELGSRNDTRHQRKECEDDFSHSDFVVSLIQVSSGFNIYLTAKLVFLRQTAKEKRRLLISL